VPSRSGLAGPAPSGLPHRFGRHILAFYRIRTRSVPHTGSGIGAVAETRRHTSDTTRLANSTLGTA